MRLSRIIGVAASSPGSLQGRGMRGVGRTERERGNDLTPAWREPHVAICLQMLAGAPGAKSPPLTPCPRLGVGPGPPRGHTPSARPALRGSASGGDVRARACVRRHTPLLPSLPRILLAGGLLQPDHQPPLSEGPGGGGSWRRQAVPGSRRGFLPGRPAWLRG